ncbi:hypothetical protein GCM10010406_33640 [Streptomyces thermolineatus]|uniref:Uncharacterized protein n=1 Tax=Streptomyces thermolineatus TaxID=44033 RepID=A0ABP5Z9B4_9ACTN
MPVAPRYYRITLVPPGSARRALPPLRLTVAETGETGGGEWPLYEGRGTQVWMDTGRHRVVRVLVEGETPAGYRPVEVLPLDELPGEL